jgi:hypothetical protein
MTKSRYERELKLVSDAAASAITAEYNRATADGSAKVRAWAVEATHNVWNHPVPRGAAMAAFQEAQHIFRADPVTLKEVLEGAQ